MPTAPRRPTWRQLRAKPVRTLRRRQAGHRTAAPGCSTFRSSPPTLVHPARQSHSGAPVVAGALVLVGVVVGTFGLFSNYLYGSSLAQEADNPYPMCSIWRAGASPACL